MLGRMTTRAMAMAALLMAGVALSGCITGGGDCFSPITSAVPPGVVPLLAGT